MAILKRFGIDVVKAAQLEAAPRRRQERELEAEEAVLVVVFVVVFV